MSAVASRKKRFIPTSARAASLRSGKRSGRDYGATAEPDWREIDFASARRTVRVEGRAINAVDLGDGDGPPVVFIHGLGGSWRNWLENIPATARSRRTIALDLPGFGESEMPDGEITIPHFAHCLEALCTELKLGEIDVVGNSMGGYVAAELAITRPQRVHRLVLVDAAGITSSDLRRWPTRTLMRAVAIQARCAPVQRMLLARPVLRHLAFRTIIRHPTRLKLDLVAHQANGPGMPGFLLAMDALLDYDFRDRLPEITAPTLIVHGEDDMLVPLTDAWEFRRLIPNSTLRVFQDTGHVAMFERPRSFNRLLGDFLGLG